MKVLNVRMIVGEGGVLKGDDFLLVARMNDLEVLDDEKYFPQLYELLRIIQKSFVKCLVQNYKN